MATFITKDEQLKRMEAALPLLKQAAELLTVPCDMAETRHIEDCWCHITDDAIVELELSIEEMTIELEREDEMDYYFHRRGVFGQLTGRAA